jgi:hypothetical protein
MIHLQPEEQLALKYILKNWVQRLMSHDDCNKSLASSLLDVYLDLAKDLDGIEADSFVLPLQRTSIMRSAMENFYHIKPIIPRKEAMAAAKHYEMLAKWFFEDKIAMTKDEVLNLGSQYGVL